MEKITEFFNNNLDWLKESGANLNDEVDTLFKGLKAVPCKEFLATLTKRKSSTLMELCPSPRRK